MTDTEILDWIDGNATRLGMRPDWRGTDTESGAQMFESTDIRARVEKLAETDKPNNEVRREAEPTIVTEQ